MNRTANHDGDKELAILIDNGLDVEVAIEALKLYGTAENVLLTQVCQEEPSSDSRHHQSITTSSSSSEPRPTTTTTIDDKFHQFLQATTNLSWRGVDLRRTEESTELADVILNQGADFLKLATSSNGMEPLETESTTTTTATVSMNQDQDVMRTKVAQLVEMGFSDTKALAALEKMDGDIEKALALLFDS
jgi:hypothetical protein